MEFSIKKDCNIYITRFPDYITIKDLKKWGEKIKKDIVKGGRYSFLIDTGSHNFESIECLKWLRDFLSQDPIIRQHINSIAFVQPEKYRSPEIVSSCEAYFTDRLSAMHWLNHI